MKDSYLNHETCMAHGMSVLLLVCSLMLHVSFYSSQAEASASATFATFMVNAILIIFIVFLSYVFIEGKININNKGLYNGLIWLGCGIILVMFSFYENDSYANKIPVFLTLISGLVTWWHQVFIKCSDFIESNKKEV